MVIAPVFERMPEREQNVVRIPAIQHFNGSDFSVVLPLRSEEHTSELQSLMRISYAVFCLKTKNTTFHTTRINHQFPVSYLTPIYYFNQVHTPLHLYTTIHI